MWGFLLSIAQTAAGFFFGSPSSITDTTVRDATAGLWASLQSLVNFLTALFGDEMVAWKKAGPNVVAGGKGLGDLAYHELYAWDRLLRVILPGSQRWQQFNTHTYVDPKFSRVWAYLTVLDKRTKFLEHWRTSYVNPTLQQWTSWREWFYTWPNRTLDEVHNWLQSPARFARWATPVLVPSFLSWLNARAHRSQRDDWTRIIVGAMPDMPDQVGHAVLSILQGPPRTR